MKKITIIILSLIFFLVSYQLEGTIAIGTNVSTSN